MFFQIFIFFLRIPISPSSFWTCFFKESFSFSWISSLLLSFWYAFSINSYLLQGFQAFFVLIFAPFSRFMVNFQRSVSFSIHGMHSLFGFINWCFSMRWIAHKSMYWKISSYCPRAKLGSKIACYNLGISSESMPSLNLDVCVIAEKYLGFCVEQSTQNIRSSFIV